MTGVADDAKFFLVHEHHDARLQITSRHDAAHTEIHVHAAFHTTNG